MPREENLTNRLSCYTYFMRLALVLYTVYTFIVAHIRERIVEKSVNKP